MEFLLLDIIGFLLFLFVSMSFVDAQGSLFVACLLGSWDLGVLLP